MKYRHLGRKSSHRQALLRNLVTSLFEHESIATTWPKAKEAQRLAEKLITLGKRNTNAARTKAEAIFFVSASTHGWPNGVVGLTQVTETSRVPTEALRTDSRTLR